MSVTWRLCAVNEMWVYPLRPHDVPVLFPQNGDVIPIWIQRFNHIMDLADMLEAILQLLVTSCWQV